MAKIMANKAELGIDIKSVEDYDRFWQELNYLRYPLEKARMGWRKASVIRKKKLKKNEKIPGLQKEIYDVIIAGGGPSGTLYASMLAQKGHSVLLVERNEDLKCGSTWNLSRDEFKNLKSTEALSKEQFDELVEGDFKHGEFRLWNEKEKEQTSKRFTTVLNVSLNESNYFKFLTKKPEAKENLKIFKGNLAFLKWITNDYAYVALNKTDAKEDVNEDVPKIYRAKLFIDATGWTSLLARTVNYGRITESWYNMIGIHSTQKLGFKKDEHGNPIGLICLTFENEIKTRAGMVQPILERFTDIVPTPGKKSEVNDSEGDVIYYFTRTERPVPLAPMFDDMLSKIEDILPGFFDDVKDGASENVKKINKTYYGHAAGYYQQGLFTRSVHQLSAGDRTLMVGVAAQQYSGLTGCAFGCLARNAKDICESINNALKKGDLRFKTLQKIDIDPRERVSQSITDLYAGSMELDPYEDPGTVNRDWISFINIGKKMDDETNADVLRDKIKINTLEKMLRISADNPETIKSLFRNNRGHAGLVVATFIKGYLKLLALEARYAFKKRQKKFKIFPIPEKDYVKAGAIGSRKIPRYLFDGSRLLYKSLKVGK